MLAFAAPGGWAALDNYRHYIAVEVLEADGVTWTPVMAWEQVPLTDGTVNANMRQAMRGIFSPKPPAFNSIFISNAEYNNVSRKFRTKDGQLTGTDVVPGAVVTNSDYLALLGGLSKLKFATLANFFYAYLPAQKKFMSWAPLEKYVDKNQEDYLNFWLTAAPAGNRIDLQITAYYDDNTTQTSVTNYQIGIDFTNPLHRLKRFPVGPLNSGVKDINPLKNVVKYVVRLRENDGGAVISEERTYIIDPVSYPNRRFIMFLSSLGSWEVIRFYGDTAEAEDYNRQIVRKYLKPGYVATDGEYEQNNVEGVNSLSLGSGYFMEAQSKQWQLYMRDLLRSPRVYDITTGTRVPLIITSNKLAGPEDRNYKYLVRFEAQEAYSNTVYTPDDV